MANYRNEQSNEQQYQEYVNSQEPMEQNYVSNRGGRVHPSFNGNRQSTIPFTQEEESIAYSNNDSLQCYLSSATNPKLGFLTFSNRISEKVYESVIHKLNTMQKTLLVEEITNKKGNQSLQLTTSKGVLLGYINGKTVPEAHEALLKGELIFTSTAEITDINEIF